MKKKTKGDTVMSRDSFIIHTRHGMLIEELDNEQRGKLLTVIFDHASGETDIDIEDKLVRMVFLIISEQMDYDRREYEKKCKRNAENAKKRWHGNDANAYGSVRKDTKPCLSDTDSDTDSDSRSDSETKADSDSKMRESETRTLAGAEKSRKAVKNPFDGASEADGAGDSEGESEVKRDTGLTEGKTGLAHSHSEQKEQKEYLQPLRGRYENVRLTAFDEATLKLEFPEDLDARIERLSEYIATHGDKYYNHAAVIRSWSKNGRDITPRARPSVQAQPEALGEDDFENNEFFKAALARSMKYLDKINDKDAGADG